MFAVCRCLAAGALAVGVASSAWAQSSPAGRVRVLSGSALVIRQGHESPVQLGQPVFEGDRLRTGKDGHLGVTLKDDTRLSLGPDSEAQIDRFLYAPGDTGVALALSILRGVAAYISGHIAKLAPDAVRISTPSAVLAVRGTHVVIRVQ
jgi:hypothetical protein